MVAGMTDALAFWETKLACETDPADVYAAQRAGEPFTLLDVRSAQAWAQGRIPGAVHMPYREIAERHASELDPAVEVVVMCWSPGCNAATKAARELAALGYRVREMIGGYEYWRREGFPAESDAGPLPCIHDPLVAVVPGA